MQYHHRDRSNPSHPAGDSRKLPLRVDFDRRLKLEFLGSKITSDAGLLAYRELDDVLGLTDLAGAALSDLRRGKNTRHLLTGLLRQSVFGRLAGYEDVNDAERLSRDPAMRAIVDRKTRRRTTMTQDMMTLRALLEKSSDADLLREMGLDRRAASTSQMGRFETEWLATDDNLAGLTALSGFWIDRVHDRRPPKMIALDRPSGTAASARPMANRKEPPTTVTSDVPAIIRCSCSTSSAIWNGAPCVLATCTPQMAGARCWSRSSADTETGSCGATFVPMPPSPRQRCMSSWRLRASCTRSAFPPTGCCNRASLIYSDDRLADLRKK